MSARVQCSEPDKNDVEEDLAAAEVGYPQARKRGSLTPGLKFTLAAGASGG